MLLIPTQAEKEEYLVYKTEADFFTNLENGIKEIEFCGIPYAEHSVLICGGMAGFDKGLLHFIETFASMEKKKGKRVILLSEVTAEYRRYTALNIKIPFLCTPHLLAKEIIVLGLDVSLKNEVIHFIANRDYLQEAIALMQARYPGIGNGYAEAWVYYAYHYINKVLTYLKPEKVILWNQFYAFHRIFDAVTRLKKIDVAYIEFGCLPGTIEFDRVGQMGESSVALYHKAFEKKKVQPNEIYNMVEVLKYLKESGLNRNEQLQKPFKKETIYRYKAGRPLIVYFGQNDYESGIYPYTRRARKYHSPIFKSTWEAFRFLENIAIKNNWNFVYKPHPIMKNLGLELNEAVNNIGDYMVDDVNLNSLIDCADVLVTIFSQCAYIAMIREKPVVMLGYTQLKGKRCSYEAFRKQKIEKTIKRALRNGFEKEQRVNFVRHCAQLKKYCLIDDLQPKEIKIGSDFL